jgi:hypothetical protein
MNSSSPEQAASSRVTIPFEITGWDQTVWSDADGVQTARAQVEKRFTGALEATSVAQVLTVSLDGKGVAYTAHEVVTGVLEGRSGSFAIAHGAMDGDDVPSEDVHAPGRVVPGSGRGELAGIAGRVELRHDDQGARLILDYTLA